MKIGLCGDIGFTGYDGFHESLYRIIGVLEVATFLKLQLVA